MTLLVGSVPDGAWHQRHTTREDSLELSPTMQHLCLILPYDEDQRVEGTPSEQRASRSEASRQLEGLAFLFRPLTRVGPGAC